MIRVLIADDSATVRELLRTILESDGRVKVVGQAANGREAVAMAVELRPDLITMDVTMPVLDGLEATKEIMVHAPTPILIVSSHASESQVELSMSALRAGALMVLPTPEGPSSRNHAEQCKHFIEMVGAMSEVKVVRRWDADIQRPGRAPSGSGARASRLRLVTIAASTGGPAALQRLLSALPPDFGPPILVVQHIAPDFVHGLARWLTANCSLHVKVAEEGELLQPRTVYLAPDGRHLSIDVDLQVQLSTAAPIGGFRPSASYLFESAARALGSSLAAVILTGMGNDGVSGLREVHARGGLILAQDAASCVVYGMPREAVAAGVVDAELPLTEIAAQLSNRIRSTR